MRDPNRIPAILDELSILWKKRPDMSLCQLLIYVETDIAEREHREPNGDLYNLDDRLVLEALQEINARDTEDPDDIEDESSKLEESLKGDETP